MSDNYVDQGAATSTPLRKGYLFGLALSNNAVDATNDIDIAVGEAVDNGDGHLMGGAAITKRLDAAWAVGTNAGGLDTGAIANATYHVWLIKRTDTGVVDALFSLSATAPTLPAGYTKKRRIGSVLRIAGSLVGFIQTGDDFDHKTPANEPDITASTVMTNYAVTVPTGVKVKAKLSFNVRGITAGTTAYFVGTPGYTEFAVTTDESDGWGSSAFNNGVYKEVVTNTSAQVAIDFSQANGTMEILTSGWIDTRGKD